MGGAPSAPAPPRWRYFATISSSENGSYASGSTPGPPSTPGTLRPPSPGRAAGGAPPPPEPMISTSVSIVLMGETSRRHPGRLELLLLREQHQGPQRAGPLADEADGVLFQPGQLLGRTAPPAHERTEVGPRADDHRDQG